MGGRKIECTAGMVAMLVRDEDRGDVAGKKAEPCKPPLGIAQGKAAINENSRRAAGAR